jgi:hypothetical protein
MKPNKLASLAATTLLVTTFAVPVQASTVSALDWPVGWQDKQVEDTGFSGYDGDGKALEKARKKAHQAKGATKRK